MITRAVIPVAGIGTRLLPLTKALPKEMLPIGDKPVLELTIRELASSGITDIYVVTSTRKSIIQNHFAPDSELEKQLEEAGKAEIAESIRGITSLARITYIYQDGPYGNGTPVLNAAKVIGDEPFIVLWGDDVFVSGVPRARQLMETYDKVQAPVLALMPIELSETPHYGVPIVDEILDAGLMRVSGLIEKPTPEEAPSRFAAIGGYVVTPAIITELERITSEWHDIQKSEIYLTDAINAYAITNPMYGRVIEGTWYDTGTPLSYMRAQLTVALSHPQYGAQIREFLAREIGDSRA